MNKEHLQKDIEDLKVSIGDIPEDTCPVIDKVISNIEEAISSAQNAVKHRNMPNDDAGWSEWKSYLEDLASDIEYYLEPLFDKMETIRTSNEKLRQLGKEWYEFSKSLIQ